MIREGSEPLASHNSNNDINPPYSCRAGICGTCMCKIKEGEVEYQESPTAEIYRQNQDVEVLDNPTTLSGEDVLPGFVLDLTEVWS